MQKVSSFLQVTIRRKAIETDAVLAPTWQ